MEELTIVTVRNTEIRRLKDFNIRSIIEEAKLLEGNVLRVMQENTVFPIDIYMGFEPVGRLGGLSGIEEMLKQYVDHIDNTIGSSEIADYIYDRDRDVVFEVCPYDSDIELVGIYGVSQVQILSHTYYGQDMVVKHYIIEDTSDMESLV